MPPERLGLKILEIQDFTLSQVSVIPYRFPNGRKPIRGRLQLVARGPRQAVVSPVATPNFHQA